MKKNVSGQKIGAQMVSATDGSAFTGSVTVYVTGDAGTQAVGSVGSGACTHEGNGFHTYAPAQAETNYDHIAFTFTGSGAVPSTVQVFTTFPQTGDSFARLGAPAGASIAADIATVDTVVDAILVDTDTTIPAALTIIDDFLDTEIAAIKAKTDLIPAGGFPTNFSLLAIDGSGNVALSATEETAIADAILARDIGSGTGAGSLNERTVRSALRFLRNKWSISGTTLTVCEEDDSTTAWTATVTPSAGADPITGNDPA